MKIKKYLTAILLMPTVLMSAQTPADSLSLADVMNQVVKNYPLLKKAEKDLVAANAKIELTKTAYLPDVNFAGSFTLLGPTTKLTMPGLGSIELYPPDNYSAAISVNQTIYDFGKTQRNIAVDSKNRDMIQYSVEQIKQKLSGGVVMSFFAINYLQEAITIKDDQLKNLKEHLRYVQTKAATGSATQYDILTTKVRISAIENQKTDLISALKIQTSQLNSLMGKPSESVILTKSNSSVAEKIGSADSLFKVAFSNRSELKIARQKEEISKSKMDVIKLQNNPSLNAFGNGGFKNGYFSFASGKPEDTGMFNYAVGIGLKVPIFDANRSKHLFTMANADYEGNKQETELARRNITTEVVECRTNAEAALTKLKQSELQVQQASQAYELSNVNYKAGTITNLDLLDSYTALSESKLYLYKTKLDYTVSLLKLKLATGEQIY